MQYHFLFQPVWSRAGLLLSGVLLTVKLSLITMALGLLLGIVAARLITSGPRWVRIAIRVYVEAIRNTPLLVQLFIVFLALPELGLRLSANEAAYVTLTVNLGAYACEIVRAGIEAVHKSQIEAGMALALTPFQVFCHVVLPPAVETVYPALASQFILVMLATSICSTISAEELTSVANNIQSLSFRSVEVYVVTAGIYLLLAIAFKILFAIVGFILFPKSRRTLLALVGAN
jgi:polar amino acid transport system permease protein